MSTLRAASVLSVLLFFFLNVFCSVGGENITAEPGQNVTLPCRAAENKPVIVLEWSRKDLGEDEHVALYQDDRLYSQLMHPAYRDRVDLQDREMKDGNVSLVLKDVTINDTGTYEGRVNYSKNKNMKRSHLDSDPICAINLDVSPPGETKIRAEPGQNVILPCRDAENKPVIVLEWSRPDLGEDEHVALYTDDMLFKRGQHPAYKDRVDLQDREMKDGNVSLVLKNVMINDTGTYKCRVANGEHKRRKRSHLDSDPICIINLDVSPPGNKGKQEDHEKNNSGPTVGLSVGVPIAVVLALLGVGVVGFLLYKRQRRPQQEQNARPAAGAELQPMNAQNGHEAEQ